MAFFPPGGRRKVSCRIIATITLGTNICLLFTKKAEKATVHFEEAEFQGRGNGGPPAEIAFHQPQPVQPMVKDLFYTIFHLSNTRAVHKIQQDKIHI